MGLKYKKVFAIAILGLLFALVAYSLAQDAQTTATNANQTANNASIVNGTFYYNYTNITTNITTNFSLNISGQPAMDDFVSLVEDGNLTLTQDTANHTIKIKALGAAGSAIIASACNPANEALQNWNGTGWTCVNIADNDPYILLTSEPNLNVNSSVYWAGRTAPDSSWGTSTPIITKITCSGGVTCPMTLDGSLSLTNITASGGLISTTSLDDNIILNVTASGGLIVTYI